MPHTRIAAVPDAAGNAGAPTPQVPDGRHAEPAPTVTDKKVGALGAASAGVTSRTPAQALAPPPVLPAVARVAVFGALREVVAPQRWPAHQLPRTPRRRRRRRGRPPRGDDAGEGPRASPVQSVHDGLSGREGEPAAGREGLASPVAAPVAGLRPSRSGRSWTLERPNPTGFTSVPLLAASTTAPSTASSPFGLLLVHALLGGDRLVAGRDARMAPAVDQPNPPHPPPNTEPPRLPPDPSRSRPHSRPRPLP